MGPILVGHVSFPGSIFGNLWSDLGPGWALCSRAHCSSHSILGLGCSSCGALCNEGRLVGDIVAGSHMNMPVA